MWSRGRASQDCSTSSRCEGTSAGVARRATIPFVRSRSVHFHSLPVKSETSSAEVVVASPKQKLDLEAKKAFLKEDLKHLFDDQGIDASQYEKVVDFCDPITKYSSLEGYLFNITMLKKVFDPVFILHDMRVKGEASIVTRWTMAMPFTPARLLPAALRQYWQPTLTFTGTSEYVFNPNTARIYRHIDTWDSVNNQDFFSLEAFSDFLRQMGDLSATPTLETPHFTVIKRRMDYEVRRYTPFTVAEAVMDCAERFNQDVLATGAVQVNPGGEGMRAFRTLAGYLFGRNSEGAALKMTTPVFSDSRGRMQFVIGEKEMQARAGRPLPAPLTAAVQLQQQAAGLYCVRRFRGRAPEEEVSRQVDLLRSSAAKDGLPLAAGGYVLARYNDPSTPGPFRRNEVLLPLDEARFDLWAGGPGA